MKPLRTMSVTLSLLIIAFFASVTICCGSPSAAEQPTTDEVKQKIQDAAQAIKAYSADQRDAAVKRVKVGLDALDERIDSLEARIDKEWDKMDQATRERSRAALKALRKKRNEVAEWYGAMKNSSSAAWEHIKKGFVNAYDALAVAWEKTEEEFKRSK